MALSNLNQKRADNTLHRQHKDIIKHKPEQNNNATARGCITNISHIFFIDFKFTIVSIWIDCRRRLTDVSHKIKKKKKKL